MSEMTPEQAVYCLEDNAKCTKCDLKKDCGQYNNGKRYMEAKRMAIKALEKQMPKKPIRKIIYVTEYFFCECGKELRYEDIYCPNCGQKIDWED